MMSDSLQFYPNSFKQKLQHLITLEQLKPAVMHDLFERAMRFQTAHQQGDAHLNQQSAAAYAKILKRPPCVMSVFFENSTRTRTTFELAAERLGLTCKHLNVQTSSAQKGESLIDTMDNLHAMGVDVFVLRHADSGAAHTLARHFSQQQSKHAHAHIPHIINAGDGQHAHPTQSLLDVFTMLQHQGAIHTLKVAIVGDVLHSRVARSNIIALSALGCPDIRVIGPATLLPKDLASWGVSVHHDMAAIEGVDVVMMLRLQKERMQNGLIADTSNYHQHYGLTQARLQLAKPSASVLHPGPINRGIEIASNVADGIQSLILKQVAYGVFIRMAVFDRLLRDHTAHQ